jgi:predicted P-loop ATPase
MSKNPIPFPTNWKKSLLVTKQGEPKVLLANATIALREAPEWKGVLGFDEFKLRTTILTAPPWELSKTGWQQRYWQDDDDAKTTEWLQHENIGVNSKTAAEAVETVAHDFPFHPVMSYLNGLTWDGVPRLDSVFSTYFGADDNLYTQTVSRISFIARRCAHLRTWMQGRHCTDSRRWTGHEEEHGDQDVV